MRNFDLKSNRVFLLKPNLQKKNNAIKRTYSLIIFSYVILSFKIGLITPTTDIFNRVSLLVDAYIMYDEINMKYVSTSYVNSMFTYF